MDPYDVLRSLIVGAALADAGVDRDPGFPAALQADDPAFWADLATEAEHHGVAPLAGAAILAAGRRAPDRVPETARQTFTLLLSRQRRAAMIRERAIDELLTAFAAAGVTMVLLKGAALAHLIYDGPETRPMNDIDLLVAPQAAEQAAAIVRELGYVFEAQYGSKYAGRMHHLPAATQRREGFLIALEIHTDLVSRDHRGSLTLDTLTAPLRTFPRRSGPPGLALGHTDMLRHLTRHTLDPVRRTRLIHLLDLSRYHTTFHGEIDWTKMARDFPGVLIMRQLVAMVLQPEENREQRLADAGWGMMPLSEILAEGGGLPLVMRRLFAPSAWWLHGYYEVPVGRSLLACRLYRHPVTVMGWLAHRLIGSAKPVTVS